jgi:hypothetical protein
VVRFERAGRSGWPINMFVLPLRGGGTLVHSPTWLGDDSTFARVEREGVPRVLFAPNYFHHLSLARFRARYPDAIAAAGRSALPRLAAKGHRGLRDIAELADLLPEGTRLLPCEGLRTGESWLSFEDHCGQRTLLVSDAFFHVERPVTGFAGFFLRRMATLPGLRIGDTFRWMAIRDRSTYRRWAIDTVAREAPRRLVVSHGEDLAGDDLVDRLVAVLEARLR